MTRGYFGVVIYNSKSDRNVGALWRGAALFGASFIGVIGGRYERQPTDTCVTEKHVPLFTWTDEHDFMDHRPQGCSLIGVELDHASVSLAQFKHPERSIYILGSEDKGIPSYLLDRCDSIVQIPTVQSWSMNVACAGSIVMYDRSIK